MKMTTGIIGFVGFILLLILTFGINASDYKYASKNGEPFMDTKETLLSISLYIYSFSSIYYLISTKFWSSVNHFNTIKTLKQENALFKKKIERHTLLKKLEK